MSEPICARAAALEQALWEGSIRPEQENELKEHAKTCAECAAILSGIDWAKYGLGVAKAEEIPVPSVDAAWRKVEGRLATPRSAWYRRTGWMAAAATLVVAVGIGYGALHGTRMSRMAPMVHTLLEEDGTASRRSMEERAQGTAQLLEAGLVDQASDVELDAAKRERLQIAYSAPAPGFNEMEGRPGGAPGLPASIDYARRPEELQATADLSAMTPRVERIASITMGVTNAREAFKAVNGLVASGGGRVVTSRLSQATSSASAEARLTVKIPVARFEGFVREIHDLGLVLAEDIQGVDRTAEYADIQGRLDDKDSMIAALRTRLAQTGLTRDEVRRIEVELGRLRTERERIETGRRALSNRTDYSTLELTLREEKPAPGAVMIRFESFLDSFGDSLGVALDLMSGGLSVMVIGLGALLPWLLLGLAIRAWWRRRSLAW